MAGVRAREPGLGLNARVGSSDDEGHSYPLELRCNYVLDSIELALNSLDQSGFGD